MTTKCSKRPMIVEISSNEEETKEGDCNGASEAERMKLK